MLRCLLQILKVTFIGSGDLQCLDFVLLMRHLKFILNL